MMSEVLNWDCCGFHCLVFHKDTSVVEFLEALEAERERDMNLVVEYVISGFSL